MNFPTMVVVLSLISSPHLALAHAGKLSDLFSRTTNNWKENSPVETDRAFPESPQEMHNDFHGMSSRSSGSNFNLGGFTNGNSSQNTFNFQGNSNGGFTLGSGGLNFGNNGNSSQNSFNFDSNSNGGFQSNSNGGFTFGNNGNSSQNSFNFDSNSNGGFQSNSNGGFTFGNNGNSSQNSFNFDSNSNGGFQSNSNGGFTFGNNGNSSQFSLNFDSSSNGGFQGNSNGGGVNMGGQQGMTSFNLSSLGNMGGLSGQSSVNGNSGMSGNDASGQRSGANSNQGTPSVQGSASSNQGSDGAVDSSSKNGNSVQGLASSYNGSSFSSLSSIVADGSPIKASTKNQQSPSATLQTTQLLSSYDGLMDALNSAKPVSYHAALNVCDVVITTGAVDPMMEISGLVNYFGFFNNSDQSAESYVRFLWSIYLATELDAKTLTTQVRVYTSSEVTISLTYMSLDMALQLGQVVYNCTMASSTQSQDPVHFFVDNVNPVSLTTYDDLRTAVQSGKRVFTTLNYATCNPGEGTMDGFTLQNAFLFGDRVISSKKEIFERLGGYGHRVLTVSYWVNGTVTAVSSVRDVVNLNVIYQEVTNCGSIETAGLFSLD